MLTSQRSRRRPRRRHRSPSRRRRTTDRRRSPSPRRDPIPTDQGLRQPSALHVSAPESIFPRPPDAAQTAAQTAAHAAAHSAAPSATVTSGSVYPDLPDDTLSLLANRDDPLFEESASVTHSGQVPSDLDPDVIESEPPAISFEQACEDCFSLLPSDLCARPAAAGRVGPQSTSERILTSLGALPSQVSKASLPLSTTVSDILSVVEPHNKDKSSAGWSVPQAAARSLAHPSAMKLPTSDDRSFVTSAIPPLDTDAHRVRISRPNSLTLPTKVLESWELRQRQQVGLLSNADLFAASLTQLASQPDPSVDVLRRLAVQVGRSTRLLLGLAISNSAEMLRVRRDAHLESSLLLPASKDTLRCAPLDSPRLFGGLVHNVAEEDRKEQLHAHVARPSPQPWKIPLKRPPPSSPGAPPSKKPKQTQQAKGPQPATSSVPASGYSKKGSFHPKGGKGSFRPKPAKPSGGSSGNRP